MMLFKEACYKLLVIVLLFFTSPVMAQVTIDTAIDFSVKDVNSITHHLFNYLDNDKIVVLDFFTTNCGPCQTYASQVSQAYEYFGCNEGNVVFIGINWGSDNDDVRIFDSLWGAHYPSVSGLQGGGNRVVDSFQVQSYPTVAIITPDHLIANHWIWPPAYDSIVQEVILNGGLPAQCTVSTNNIPEEDSFIRILSTGELLIDPGRFNGGEMVLSIYSVTGMQLYEIQIVENNLKIINLALKKGLYLGVLKSNNKLLGTVKVIIP